MSMMQPFNLLQTFTEEETGPDFGVIDKPTVNDKIKNYTLGLGHKRYYNNALYDESDVGVNLWNHTRTSSYSGNGITVDYDNATGFYTINGTATSTDSVFINTGTSSPALALSGKTITLSLQNKSGTVVDAGSRSSAVVGRQGDNTVDAVVYITENSRTTVLPADVNHLRFYIASGAVFTNFKFQVQFEIGSVATQWVPYVPAVSPSSALPIVTAGNGVYSLGAVKAGTFSSDGVTAVVSAQTVNINCSANTGLFFVRLNDGVTATTFENYLALKTSTYSRPANIQYTLSVKNVTGTTSNASFPAVAALFADTTSDVSTRKVLYPYNGITSLTFTRASALTAVVVGVNATGVTATNCTFMVELVSVMQETTAKAEITAKTKNLFNISNYTYKLTGDRLSKTDIENGFILTLLVAETFKGMFVKIPNEIALGNTFTVSADFELLTKLSGSTLRLGYRALNGSVISTSIVSVNTSGKYNTTYTFPNKLPSDADYFCFFFNCNTTNINLGDGVKVTNIQLEKGPTTTAYQPYSRIDYNFTFTAKDALKQSLINNALTIGDYASQIYVRDGKSYALIKTAKKIFDGTEAWLKYAHDGVDSYKSVFYTSNLTNKAFGYKKSICNYFQNEGNNSVWSINTNIGVYADHPTNVGIYFAWTTENKTVADWKAYLAGLYAAGNPVTIYYVLATPVEIEIEPLTNMETFYPYTKIASTDDTSLLVSAKVRKLGNRPYVNAPLTTANGTILTLADSTEITLKY